MKKKIVSMLLTACMLLSVATLGTLTASAESSYAVATSGTTIVKTGFDFVNGLNSGVEDAIFTDTLGTVKGASGRSLPANGTATIKIPKGFRYIDDTVYDIYLEVTNNRSSAQSGNWGFNYNTTYHAIEFKIGGFQSGDVTMTVWLADSNGTQVTGINFIVGCCAYGNSENIQFWTDDGCLYTNMTGNLTWRSGESVWKSDNGKWNTNGTTDNWYAKYMFGHGTDNGAAKMRYMANSTGGTCEWVIGYLDYNVTFAGDGFASFTNETETYAEGETIGTVPSYSVSTGYNFSNWTIDQPVVLSDKTAKVAGAQLTTAELEKVIVTRPLNVTANTVATNPTTEIEGGRQYASFSDALLYATASSTINLLADVNESITVANDKEVSIDLNGHVLTTDGSTTLFTNNGTVNVDLTGETEIVKIIDYTGLETMTLQDYGTIALKNKGDYILRVIENDLCAVHGASITYMVNGETTVITDAPVDYVKEVGVLADDFRTIVPTAPNNMFFIGWFDQAEGGVKQTSISTEATADVILYAHFGTDNSDKMDTVSAGGFESADGQTNKSPYVAFGATFTDYATVEVEKYGFYIYNTNLNLDTAKRAECSVELSDDLVTAEGRFFATVTDVNTTTTYYAKAYVVIDGQYYFSELMSATGNETDWLGNV